MSGVIYQKNKEEEILQKRKNEQSKKQIVV